MADITRRERPARRNTTRRILTGGEIGQERDRAISEALGMPRSTGDPADRPMRSTADMVTPQDVRRRVRKDFGRG
jgi:hypothetical protein